MTPAARRQLIQLLMTPPPVLLMAVKPVLQLVKVVLPLVKAVLPAAKVALVDRWEVLKGRDKKWVNVLTITMME